MAEPPRQVLIALSRELWTVHQGYIKSLEGVGIQVSRISDVQEFLDRAGEGASLLVVGTATGMAGIAGQELIRRLGELSPRPRAPVLLLQDPRTPPKEPPATPLAILKRWNQAREVLGLVEPREGSRAAPEPRLEIKSVKLKSRDPTLELTAPRARPAASGGLGAKRDSVPPATGGVIELTEAERIKTGEVAAEPEPAAQRPSYVPPAPPPVAPYTDDLIAEGLVSKRPKTDPDADALAAEAVALEAMSRTAADEPQESDQSLLSLVEGSLVGGDRPPRPADPFPEGLMQTIPDDITTDLFKPTIPSIPTVAPYEEPEPIEGAFDDLEQGSPVIGARVAPPEAEPSLLSASPREPSRTAELRRRHSKRILMIAVLCLILGASVATSIVLLLYFNDGGAQPEEPSPPVEIVDAGTPPEPEAGAISTDPRPAADAGEVEDEASAGDLRELPDELILPMRFDRHRSEPYTIVWREMWPIVRLIKANPETEFELVGHASPDELPRRAKRLGLTRAKVVRDLICLKGPSRDRFAVRSAGSSSPLSKAPDDSRDLMEASRRVVLRRVDE